MSNSSDTRVPEQEPENMAMSMAGGGPSGPQMNVTPMIDVLLVLIIIFMVIVMSSKHEGLRTQIPEPAPDSAKASPPEPQRTIVIQLQEASGKDDTPKVKINAEEVSWEQLEPRLFDIYKQRAEKVAFVEGDDGVEFRFVADVIDEAREAGVQTIGLMPKQVAAAQ